MFFSRFNPIILIKRFCDFCVSNVWMIRLFSLCDSRFNIDWISFKNIVFCRTIWIFKLKSENSDAPLMINFSTRRLETKLNFLFVIWILVKIGRKTIYKILFSNHFERMIEIVVFTNNVRVHGRCFHTFISQHLQRTSTLRRCSLLFFKMLLVIFKLYSFLI